MMLKYFKTTTRRSIGIGSSDLKSGRILLIKTFPYPDDYFFPCPIFFIVSSCTFKLH